MCIWQFRARQGYLLVRIRISRYRSAWTLCEDRQKERHGGPRAEPQRYPEWSCIGAMTRKGNYITLSKRDKADLYMDGSLAMLGIEQ